MKKWKAWVWMLVIFVSGAAAGSGATMLFAEKHIRKFMDRPPKEMRRDIMERITHKLDLTEEQKIKAEPIITKSFEEGRAIMDAAKPKLDAILDRTQKELRPILTDDQMERFKRFVERVKRRGPPHPPPPPPLD